MEGDLLVQEVDILLRLFHLSQLVLIPVQHRAEAGLHISLGHEHHAPQLMLHLVHIDGGHAQAAVLAADLDGGEVLQVHLVHLVAGAVGQDAHRSLRQIVAQRQEQQGGNNIEAGVDQGDLPGRSRRQYPAQTGHRDLTVDHMGNGEQNEEERKDDRTDYVEHQMDDGGPLGAAAGANGGQNCRDTGADILTEQHEYRAGQPDHTAVSQRLKDTHRGRGRLDYRSKARTSQNTQQRVGEIGHHLNERLRLPQGRHCTAHHIHSDKQHTQTSQNLADVLKLRLLDKDHHGHTNKGKQRGQFTHIQSNQQSSNGGADVGAHDDPNRLIQCHHPGVDKAHHHNCGGRGGLDHRGDRRTYQYAQETVCRQPLQNLLHPAAGCRLQAGTHHLHSV